jgi:hypothetical protein
VSNPAVCFQGVHFSTSSSLTSVHYIPQRRRGGEQAGMQLSFSSCVITQAIVHLSHATATTQVEGMVNCNWVRKEVYG